MSGAPFVLTAAEMAHAFGGTLVSGVASTPLPDVSIDTRTLQPGALFVAIAGPTFDGHAFLRDAVARGAAGVVVSDADVARDLPDTVAVIHVHDTLLGMQQAAHVVRMRSRTRLVAITGSAGKTTTKEITAALLSTHFTTFRTQGNLNNHIGLPLSLFALRTCPAMGVVELGMSGPGEIRRLVEIADPDVRVWTNVGSAHLGHFASVEQIADAKAEILEHADRGDVLVANAGDARVMQHARRFVGRTITFGVDVDADVQVRDVEPRGAQGMRARLVVQDDSRLFDTPLLGEGNLANIAAAAAVAVDAGVPLDAIVHTVGTLAAAPHRGQVVHAAGGWTVIDDAYNSSPEALLRALTTLGSATGRRIALLGEMLELGVESPRLHAECGRAAAAAGIAHLVVVGGTAADALASSAVEAGLDPACVSREATSEVLARRVRAIVRPGDVVLVKGSRGIAMDRVVAALMEEA
jgi:UDP-N-acetylmuramoyl-tripeptide--D-alanyl-D-alanine ligase